MESENTAPPVVVKTAVLFWVHSHTNVFGPEEEHFRRLYTGNRESTMSLLLLTLSIRRLQPPVDPALLSGAEQALAEIMQDIGAGPFLRATLNAMKHSKLMGNLQRIRNCFAACSRLYHESGEPSFREVYLQMPMLSMNASLCKPNMPAFVTGRDPATDKAGLEAYHSAWRHMSYAIVL